MLKPINVILENQVGIHIGRETGTERGYLSVFPFLKKTQLVYQYCVSSFYEIKHIVLNYMQLCSQVSLIV